MRISRMPYTIERRQIFVSLRSFNACYRFCGTSIKNFKRKKITVLIRPRRLFNIY